jgi:hypothetical protein
MQFFSLRATFLLGFIVAMPVLALPSVARRIDAWLYGAPPADFGRPPVPPPLTDEPIAPIARSNVAPARFDEASPAPQSLMPQSYVQQASATGRYEPAASPSPFAPATVPSTTLPSAAEPQIDERTIARLQQIRQRLEELGAEYVLVDTQDSGRFRFHCRMIVDGRSRATRSFEGTSFDPVAAGEQVLGDVERWRATPITGPVRVGP